MKDVNTGYNIQKFLNRTIYFFKKFNFLNACQKKMPYAP